MFPSRVVNFILVLLVATFYSANGAPATPIKKESQKPTSTPPNKLANEAPADSKPVSPADALKYFHVADDLEIEQLLAEPIVEQPVFLNFDERGRMWVVQYRQYPAPAGLKAVSHD